MDLSQVLQRLARSNVSSDGNLQDVLKDFTQAAADTLGSERVTIWVFDESRTALECIEGFDSKTQKHESGRKLMAADFPSFFQALENMTSFVSVHAEHDPSIVEFKERSVIPDEVKVRVDVPIFLSGKVVGVVCHEQTGSPRDWTVEEMSFASSIADFVSIALEADRRDRAEQHELELQARLLECSRLESLGLFAGSIAHDFNNLVGVILVHTDLALIIANQESRLRSHILEIQNAAEHAAMMCQQLLNYSNPRRMAVEEVNLSTLVEEILRMIKVVISDKAVLRYEFNHDLPPLQADAMQLRQLVMNVITNASDALGGEPGTITVKTGVEHLAQDELQGAIHAESLRDGRYVFVEVSDTGSGMDPETQQKMFEPFFTTKISGRGLGLAAVLDFVRSHKGTIQVESQLHQGTRIRVLLPANEPSAGEGS
jgi:signal transduction histidine kinase